MMRWLAYAWLAFGMLVADAATQGALGDRLELGDQAYRSGAWQRAAEHYTSILDRLGSDTQSGAVLLRLGNAHYKSGSFGQALLAYERAYLRLGDDPDLSHNRARCRAALGLDAEPAPAWPERVPTALLAALAITFQAVGLWFAGARRRGRLGALLVLVGLGAAAWTMTRTLATPRAEALVVTASCEIRADPHESAAAILALPTGSRVVVAESSDRWARIAHDRGTGWVPRHVIGRID